MMNLPRVHHAKSSRRLRDKLYDGITRQQDAGLRNAKRIRSSAAWTKTSKAIRAAKFCANPFGVHRKHVPATDVHHVVKLRDDASKALDGDNLMALCRKCHRRMELKQGDMGCNL